jgi:hypothetical protein
MSERLRLSSPLQLRKHVRSGDSSQDHISSLPEEILVAILSRVTLKEAARTSVISHKWKYLWTFTTLNMDFEAPSIMFQLNSNYCENRATFFEIERKKFVKWVDQVLESHKGEVAERFKVCFGLDITYKLYLDRWIEFAIQKKRVSRLEVSLGYTYRFKMVQYHFPEEVLCYSNIKLLRVLRMCNVEVDGPLLEDILTKCPSLEEMSLSLSETLRRVKLNGINLKLIKIRRCFKVEYLEVDAPNLTSFVYTGGKPSIRLTNSASKLHALELGGWYCDRNFPMFPEVSSFFSQIDTLIVDCDYRKVLQLPPVFPEYKILKYLNLKLSTEDNYSLLSSISLIKACPMLHTLVVEFWWMSDHIKRKFKKRSGEELKCLKVVEFRWFYGRSADVELAITIIKNAPLLEKITFDPWCPESENEQSPLGDRGLGPVYDFNVRRINARKCSRQLANKYCPGVQLVVL